MGQIDSRIDNLESWLYDDEDDEQHADMRVCGREVRSGDEIQHEDDIL